MEINIEINTETKTEMKIESWIQIDDSDISLPRIVKLKLNAMDHYKKMQMKLRNKLMMILI